MMLALPAEWLEKMRFSLVFSAVSDADISSTGSDLVGGKRVNKACSWITEQRSVRHCKNRFEGKMEITVS